MLTLGVFPLTFSFSSYNWWRVSWMYIPILVHHEMLFTIKLVQMPPFYKITDRIEATALLVCNVTLNLWFQIEFKIFFHSSPFLHPQLPMLAFLSIKEPKCNYRNCFLYPIVLPATQMLKSRSDMFMNQFSSNISKALFLTETKLHLYFHLLIQNATKCTE